MKGIRESEQAATTLMAKSMSQDCAYSWRTQQQVLICLQSSTVELTLNPIQRLEALKAGLGILWQLLHWKQLLEG